MSSKGIVTSKGKGTATITAKTANNKKATVRIRVTLPDAKKVTLNKKSVTLKIGKRVKLTAKVRTGTDQGALRKKSDDPCYGPFDRADPVSDLRNA